MHFIDSEILFSCVKNPLTDSYYKLQKFCP
jgi:hypothetical protein